MKTVISYSKTRTASPLKTAAVLIGSVGLAACNGGGSDSPSGNVLEGQFVDSPVEGLRYETQTQSGLTDENGTFTYLADETVTFYLGKTELGRAAGSDTLTPFDITGHKALDTEVEIERALNAENTVNSYDRALNIANLLQTLDVDENPDNGIDLGDAHTALSNHEIDLRVKAVDFTTSEDFIIARQTTGQTQTRSFQNVVEHIYNNLNIEISSSQTGKQSNVFGANSSQSLDFEYDNDGKLVGISFDQNNDGSADAEKTFSYDGNGNLSGINDTLNAITETLSYNGANQLSQRTRTDGNGDQDQENFTYNAQGQLEVFSLDFDANGSSDVTASFTYDQNGKISSVSSDVDGDEVNDRSAQFVYSGNTLTEYREDTNGNGDPDLTVSYRYDTQGNPVTLNTRSEENTESYSTRRFEYDANNNPTRYELDNNQDGQPEYIEAYKYNASNQRIQYQKDLDADGRWDFTAQYFYDINGNRIRMIEDNDGNGIVDKVWESGYESAVLANSWERIIENL